MKPFTIGVAVGMTALTLAVPLIVQVSSAASGQSSSVGGMFRKREMPAPSQACVQALAGKDTAMLGTMDAMMAKHKAVMSAHRDALLLAADIQDETQRQAAVKKANEDMRTAMQADRDAGETETMKAAMEAVKTACGTMGFGRGMMGDKGFMGMKHGGRKGPMGMHHMEMRDNDDMQEKAAAKDGN